MIKKVFLPIIVIIAIGFLTYKGLELSSLSYEGQAG